MTTPKDTPDTPASVSGWLQDHDDGLLTDALDKQPPNMGKDAQDAQT